MEHKIGVKVNRQYESLNEKQIEAIEQIKGPVLVLAGAGSGKTSVLTHRIAHLINDEHVNPYNIMAITFTNKAAAEMKERIAQLVPGEINSLWITTFHSTCYRILRQHADKLNMGYKRDFTIYDEEDQNKILKEIIKEKELEKTLSVKTIRNTISELKMKYEDAERYAIRVKTYDEKQKSVVYKAYEETMRNNNAMDFEDLLVNSVRLLTRNKEILEYYQNRFQYILVDEYQDTDMVQMGLINLIAKKYKNLCVVGDDDQAIYKFRGADIRNILGFRQLYPNARIVKMEQNYRCTKNILSAANSVIKNNSERMDKTLWNENEEGELLHYRRFSNANAEAMYIIGDILRNKKQNKYTYSQNVILYRTNAQSRAFEEVLVEAGLPYEIIGSLNFYQRKEVKDILAYLHVINNPNNDISMKRIINVPTRNIGDRTVEKMSEYARINNISLYEAMKKAEFYIEEAVAQKINFFCNMISVFRTKMEYMTLDNLIEDIIETVKYEEYLKGHEKNADDKIDNVTELIYKTDVFVREHKDATVTSFLSEVALANDADLGNRASKEKIALMTIHCSKGLEFDHVYLSGMEENLFPLTYSDEELQTERRLAYVAITRAKKELSVTSVVERNLRGSKGSPAVSCFVYEIPRITLDRKLPDKENPSKEDIDDKKIYQSIKKIKRKVEVSENEKIGRSNYQISEKSVEEEALERGTTESCITLIRKFYQKKNRKQADFYSLRVGCRDNISGFYYQKLVSMVDDNERKEIETNFDEIKEIEAALRWIVRGLLVKDAVKKVELNKKQFH